MWVDPAKDPRETGTRPVGEKATLVDYLRAYRVTIEMKCEGLDAEQMARRSVPPSTMSLLGLVRHLARVEHHWFRRVMEAQDLPRLYRTEEDPDLDFNGAVADPAVVADAWASWRREVAHAEEYVENAESLEVEGRLFEGGTIPLREVLVHMIEEYARHAGHADLLRECIDGRTGQ
jgi:uncharacterized damage-inducible protein DinB